MSASNAKHPVSSFPYRWAVGSQEALIHVYDEASENTFHYLPAGERAVVWGAIRMTEVKARNPQNCWAGLIHEDVAISLRNNHVGMRAIMIVDPAGRTLELRPSELQSKIDLAVVVVTWNNARVIADALRSLLRDLATSGLRTEVWLSDSASDDHTVDIVRREYADVRLLTNQKNIGFGPANNQALRRLGFGGGGRRDKPRAVYLLNPDTITHSGATKQLYDTLLSQSDIGVVGARLTFGDGSFQHSAFDFPGLRQIWAELSRRPGGSLKADSTGATPRSLYAAAKPFEVGFTLGASMMLRREAIEQSGLFDEEFFLYCEEVDWAWRIRKLGWRILCAPQAHVTHLGGQSTTQARPSSLIHLWKSRLLLYEKHHPTWKTRLARMLIVLGMRRKLRSLGADVAKSEPPVRRLSSWRKHDAPDGHRANIQ